MNKKISLSLVIVVGIGLVLGGFLLGAGLTYKNPTASAQDSCTITETQLTEIYNAIFHRPLDAGARGYINHGLEFVLGELSRSQEHIMYSGMFTATKALENARRESGDITASDEDDYIDIVDSALSHINEWAKTLSVQARTDAAIGPVQARNAIQAAYNNMNTVARQAAERGLFQAQKVIGQPSDLPTPGE
jgi:hypothetical protein